MLTLTIPVHESNDCHTPAGSAAGGQFCSDSGPIWQIPKSTYAPFPGEYDDAPSGPYQTYRRREREWERAVKTAIATGKITPETAGQLAGSEYVFKPQTERGVWEELPRTLYHVTVNRDAVLKTGLQTKEERGAPSGEGLGGGDSSAISFTANKQYAGVIYDTFHELHDVATGATTVDDLVQMAEAGSSGSRPFLDRFKTFVQSSHGDFDWWRQGLVPHHEFAIPASKIPKGAIPIQPGWRGRDEQIYHGYLTPMTREQRLDANTQVFNAWLTARQERGGPENPWFTFNDARALARIPRDQIAVLEVHMKPGSKGWFQSPAEHEWRVPTGQVVQSVKVLRTNNRRWGR